MNKLLLALGALILIMPSGAYAGLITAKESVSFTAPVSDDIYTAGNTIRITAPVKGDITAAGQNIDITEHVQGDITAAGEAVTLSGPADDDVRLAGRHLRLESSVGDDLFAAGQDIELSNATVQGDAYLAGQHIIISGTINGTVRAAGEKIEIASGAHIKGGLITWGTTEPVIADSAVIDGPRQHHTQKAEPAPVHSLLLSWLRSVATWFVVASLLLYVLPAFSYRILGMAWRSPGTSFLIGIGWVLLTIPATLLLFFSVIGIPIGIALVTASIALWVVSTAYAALFVGTAALKSMYKTGDTPSWQHALFGAVIYSTARFIPLIGMLAMLILTIFMAGVLLQTVWKMLRSKPA